MQPARGLQAADHAAVAGHHRKCSDSFVVFRSPTDPQKLLRAQMQETYSQSLSGHTGMGTWELGLGTDGWYRHGAAQEVLVNCRK